MLFSVIGSSAHGHDDHIDNDQTCLVCSHSASEKTDFLPSYTSNQVQILISNISIISIDNFILPKRYKYLTTSFSRGPPKLL